MKRLIAVGTGVVLYNRQKNKARTKKDRLRVLLMARRGAEVGTILGVLASIKNPSLRNILLNGLVGASLGAGIGAKMVAPVTGNEAERVIKLYRRAYKNDIN